MPEKTLRIHSIQKGPRYSIYEVETEEGIINSPKSTIPRGLLNHPENIDKYRLIETTAGEPPSLRTTYAYRRVPKSKLTE